MHMIMYNSLLFPTLSIAYIMLIEMYCNGLYGIVSPPQLLGISSLHKSLHSKWLNKLSYVKPISIHFYTLALDSFLCSFFYICPELVNCYQVNLDFP